MKADSVFVLGAETNRLLATPHRQDEYSGRRAH